MPFINIKVLKGVLSNQQKKEMIKRVTEVVADIETGEHPTENLLPYTWCLIEEVPFEHWGASGAPVTPETLRNLIEQAG